MAHRFAKLSKSKLLWSALLGLFIVGCQLFEETASKASIGSPTATSVASGDIALVRGDTSKWCWQEVILLKSDQQYTKTVYQGTLTSSEERGRYEMSSDSLIFSERELKGATDTAFLSLPNDKFSMEILGAQYTLIKSSFGVPDSTVYQRVDKIDLGACSLQEEVYQYSSPFPCGQTIFQTQGEFFNHKKYIDVNGVATLEFEYRGIYSFQNGQFVTENVSKRTKEGDLFVEAEYTPELTGVEGTSFTISVDSNTTQVAATQDAVSKVACFELPEVPDVLAANYYVDSVRSIFQQQCMPCHIQADGQPSEGTEGFQGWSMDSSTVSSKVKPGAPFESTIFKAVFEGENPFMPILGDGRRYLNKEELDRIYIWISKDAPIGSGE
jgi:hypothetical protein